METFPFEGIWSLVVRRREPCKVVPGNVMMISRVTIPQELRAPGDSQDGEWRCRLYMWRLDSKTKEPVEKAIVASLVPGSIDTDGLEVYMFPGEQYALQVVGGGEYLHILGEFPEEYAGTDKSLTIIRRFKCLPENDTPPGTSHKKDDKTKPRDDDKGKGRDDDKGKGRDDDKGNGRDDKGKGRVEPRLAGGASGVKIK